MGRRSPVFSGNSEAFPNNAVILTSDRLKTLDVEVPVFRRRLYNTDPHQCIGITPATWAPDVDSYEMRGNGSLRPTINRYNLAIQAKVTDMDDERGLLAHAEMSQAVRNMIMGDAVLRSTLQSLRSTLYGVTESVRAWTVESQRYMSEEASGLWTFLSTLSVRLETEITSG